MPRIIPGGNVWTVLSDYPTYSKAQVSSFDSCEINVLCDIIFDIFVQLGGTGNLEGLAGDDKNGIGNLMKLFVGV